MDAYEENDRPTLPAPLPYFGRFDTAAEAFFSVGQLALDAAVAVEARAAAVDEDEMTAWWVDQRRRVFARWVAAMMVVCAGVVAAGLLYTSV